MHTSSSQSPFLKHEENPSPPILLKKLPRDLVSIKHSQTCYFLFPKFPPWIINPYIDALHIKVPYSVPLTPPLWGVIILTRDRTRDKRIREIFYIHYYMKARYFFKIWETVREVQHQGGEGGDSRRTERGSIPGPWNHNLDNWATRMPQRHMYSIYTQTPLILAI